MLRTAIVDKLTACVDEIFESLQGDLGISDGSIEPLQALALDASLETAAGIILEVLRTQLQIAEEKCFIEPEGDTL